MSLTLSSEAATSAGTPRRLANEVTWLAAAALLLAEYLLTSWAADIRPLTERNDWLGVLGTVGSVGPIVLAVATATLLIAGRQVHAELRRALEATGRSEERSLLGRFALIATHLVSFSAFLSLSIVLSQAGEERLWRAGFLAVAWANSGVVALLALGHGVVPLRLQLRVVRRLAPALAVGMMLGIMAWAAGMAAVRISDPLGTPTLHSVAATLRLISSSVEVDATVSILKFEGFAVVIDSACSGYQGIGLFLILMPAYLLSLRRELRFPYVLALLPIGIGLLWLANVLRIAGLVLVGARWAPEVALGSFHSKAGWALFCGVTLGLVALTRRAPVFSRGAAMDSGATWNPTAAYVGPLLALVGVHMGTGLFTEGLPLLYPLGVVASAGVVWWHRSSYPWLLRPSWSWEACAIGVAAFALWIVLEPGHDVAAVDVWRQELAALPLPVATAWLALRAFGSVIVVPLAEELAFRGFLLRRLFSVDFTSVAFAKFGWVSFFVSSLAYGLLHERWLAGTLAGMLFAFILYRRGRLTDAVIAHAVTNLLVALHAIGLQRWALWM